MVHDFHERLAWSEAASDDPIWEAFYRQAFKDFMSCSRNSGNNLGQQNGIDRFINLSTGKTLTVDEKKRSHSNTGDVALEYVSNDQRNTLGWVAKPSQMDYLAYAWWPARKCVLLPFPLLRRAWLVRGDSWVRKYRTISAPNHGYNTLSVVVPTDVLRQTIADALWVTLPPECRTAQSSVVQLTAPVKQQRELFPRQTATTEKEVA